jgi:phage anti-repressor protein
VSPAGRSRPSPSVGETSFVCNAQALYIIYDTIASNYSGWNFTEIRQMSARQREYWIAMIKWKRERARDQHWT